MKPTKLAVISASLLALTTAANADSVGPDDVILAGLGGQRRSATFIGPHGVEVEVGIDGHEEVVLPHATLSSRPPANPQVNVRVSPRVFLAPPANLRQAGRQDSVRQFVVDNVPAQSGHVPDGPGDPPSPSHS